MYVATIMFVLVAYSLILVAAGDRYGSRAKLLAQLQILRSEERLAKLESRLQTTIDKLIEHRSAVRLKFESLEKKLEGIRL